MLIFPETELRALPTVRSSHESGGVERTTHAGDRAHPGACTCATHVLTVSGFRGDFEQNRPYPRPIQCKKNSQNMIRMSKRRASELHRCVCIRPCAWDLSGGSGRLWVGLVTGPSYALDQVAEAAFTTSLTVHV